MILAKYLKLIRLNDWFDKIWAIIICFLILYFTAPNIIKPLDYLNFIIYICLLMSFGYLLNSYAEQDIDLASGKDRGVKIVKKSTILTGLSILILLVAVWPLFFKNLSIVILNVLIIFLAVFYSLPPLHFKKRGVWGVIVASITQGPIEFFFFLFLTPNYWLAVILLSLWLLVINLYMQILHQAIDYKNDLKTQIKTFVVNVGKDKAEHIINFNIILMLGGLAIPFFLVDKLYISLALSLLMLIFYLPLFAAYRNYKKF